MLEVFLTEEQKKLREEVRDFVKSIPRQLLLDMDADKVRYPKEFLIEALGRPQGLGGLSGRKAQELSRVAPTLKGGKGHLPIEPGDV